MFAIFFRLRFDINAFGTQAMKEWHQLIQRIFVGLHKRLKHVAPAIKIDQPVQRKKRLSGRSGPPVQLAYLLVVQNLDCDNPSRPQQLEHFRDYFLTPGPRNVIEHKRAMDEVKTPPGREERR